MISSTLIKWSLFIFFVFMTQYYLFFGTSLNIKNNDNDHENNPPPLTQKNGLHIQQEEAKKMIIDLKNTLKNNVAQHLPQNTSVSLLFVPIGNSNCGDQVLGVASRLLIHELGLNLKYVHTSKSSLSQNEQEIRSKLPDKQRSALLVYPGGNLGDLWNVHGRYIDLVERFPDYKIIFLPQSIWFKSSSKQEAMKEAFSRHPDITIFVRENPSLALCHQIFSSHNCVLVPDTAMMYGPIGRRRQESDIVSFPSSPILFLKRTDKESKLSLTSSVLKEKPHIQIQDFISDINSQRVKLLEKPFSTDSIRYCEAVADMGFSILARGDVVITDRLHGHLMSLLMGIPHVVLVNSYHKISGTLDTWTGNSPITYRAANVEEAVDIAETILCQNQQSKYSFCFTS